MDTRYETRRNALEVLRKTYKSTMLCELPQVKKDVLADGRTLVGFADSMEDIVRQLWGGKGIRISWRSWVSLEIWRL